MYIDGKKYRLLLISCLPGNSRKGYSPGLWPSNYMINAKGNERYDYIQRIGNSCHKRRLQMIFLCPALNDDVKKKPQWINNQNNAEHWEDHCWKCRWMFPQPGNLWSVQLASQLKKKINKEAIHVLINKHIIWVLLEVCAFRFVCFIL